MSDGGADGGDTVFELHVACVNNGFGTIHYTITMAFLITYSNVEGVSKTHVGARTVPARTVPAQSRLVKVARFFLQSQLLVRHEM